MNCVDDTGGVRGSAIRFHHRDFDVATLAAAKQGRRVSVCLPARDEEATVGTIVARVLATLGGEAGLVDEVLVVDDGSVDGTAVAAAAAGARVVRAANVLPDEGYRPGKGEALWKAVAAAEGDVLAFCDADVRDFDPRFVVGLVGPLLEHDGVRFVKAFYERAIDGRPRGGGRVTELMARPVVASLFPALAGIVQPLAGEFAAPREVLERVPFAGGYAVDLALLIDVAAMFGAASIAQVDLGARVHRNRPLHELGPMATAILLMALRRAGVDVPTEVVLDAPDEGATVVTCTERPPLVDVPGYRCR